MPAIVLVVVILGVCLLLVGLVLATRHGTAAPVEDPTLDTRNHLDD